ncbi:Uncharacterised protein [uncultured Flavonifractor sp.]|nr:Uncharacterised protein [uncultured Flavonifractor sp.]
MNCGALLVSNSELIGNCGLERLIISFITATWDLFLFFLNLESGILNQSPQRGVGQILVHVNVPGILQSVTLRMPLKRQSECSLLVLHSLDDAVGGLCHYGQSIGQIFRIDGLMVGSGNQFDLIRADNVIQPLGIRRNTYAIAVCAGVQFMITLTAAVDQPVNLHAQVTSFTVFTKFGVSSSPFVVGAAKFFSVLVILGVAGILYGLSQDFGDLFKAELFTGGFKLGHFLLRGAGKNTSDAGGRDLSFEHLLTQIIRYVLDQFAAEGDIETLLTPADGQQRHV